MMWRDDQFDYFRTSDGYLFRVVRDLEREAAEVDFDKVIHKWQLINWSGKCLVYAFVTADILVLVTLLIGGWYE